MTEKPPSLLAEHRSLLEKHNLAALKRFGQNFLIDRHVLNKIVAAAELTWEDTVIEVGPGLGVLTRELAARAGSVIAVEIDRGLAAILGQEFEAETNVKIIEDDILQTDPKSLVENKPYKIVANLPYNITSPTLRHFLEASKPPSLAVVTVQKEVARQIVAAPGEMSLLAVAVQFYAHPEIIANVPPGAFYPAPKVSSAILKLSISVEPPLDREQATSFFNLARAGFAARRKQLINTLSAGLRLDKDALTKILNQVGIAPQRRAETLSVPEWLKLYRELNRA